MSDYYQRTRIPVENRPRPGPSGIGFAESGDAGGWYPWAHYDPGSILAQFRGIDDDGPHTVSGVTDMAFSREIVPGRTYRIEFVGAVTVTAVGGPRWDLVYRANGTHIGRALTTLQFSAAGGDPSTGARPAYFSPVTTSGIVDFDLFANEITGGSDLTIQATSTVPRWLTLWDCGIIPPGFLLTSP